MIKYSVQYSFDIKDKYMTTGVTHFKKEFNSQSDAQEEYNRLTKAYEHIYGDDLSVRTSTRVDNNCCTWYWWGECKSHHHQHSVVLRRYEWEDE